MTHSFIETLAYTPDKFQEDAMDLIAQGDSVVVCAPTGSGKTLIAEYAVFKALELGKKVFYTTPLKALSNQKFNDFKALYGEAKVGLLTGDTSINRDAPVIVMTTEIFRNMLYGLSEDSRLLGDVGYVVLDECHYMNDAQRGTVWEESVIYCPNDIQLIALSATIANAEELTQWIHDVHPTTRLIHSDFRPVPLRFFYYNREELMPLFEGGKSKENSKENSKEDKGQDKSGLKMNSKLKFEIKGNRFTKTKRKFDPNGLILELQQKNMLPAIFFTFSRNGCDQSAKGAKRLNLLSSVEKELIRRRIKDYVARHPFLEGNPHLEVFESGFASHHAGLLPGLKGLVESLFQEGLIKAVFATETLAAGINMPARSTVITSLSKRTDEGHRLLHASEFLQMSGRAGRRGMDEVGYVTIVSSPYEGAREAATLASSDSDPLNSQFTPSYSMVLNMLQRNSVDEAQFLIQKSFGQFSWKRRMIPLLQEIDENQKKYESYLKILEENGLDEKKFNSLLKTRTLIHETHRFLRSLKKQVKRYGSDPMLAKQLHHEEAKLANFKKSLDEAPVNIYDLLSEHKRLDLKLKRTRKHLKHLSFQNQGEEDRYWRKFINLYNLLKASGYIDENDKPTKIGELTAHIRAENEFLIAEMINKGLLEGLSPNGLAGVACALIYDSNRENLYTDFNHSGEIQMVVTEMSHEARRIHKLQRNHDVDTPITVNPLVSGLMEAWAQDMPWERLLRGTNLSEGDIVRIARRTADMLRQWSRIPGMSVSVAKNARIALHTIMKDPIKEPETEEVFEDPSEKPENTEEPEL